MYHITVPPLQGPDGMIKVPYFSAKLYAVKERKIFLLSYLS